MIYIIDGMSGAGKTTYAKTLGLPIKKLSLRTIEEVISELEGKNDVVYDRFLNVYYLDENEAFKINEYFSKRSDIVCKMFICDVNKGYQRALDTGRPVTWKHYQFTHDACVATASRMPCYDIINIDEEDKEAQQNETRNNSK